MNEKNIIKRKDNRYEIQYHYDYKDNEYKHIYKKF